MARSVTKSPNSGTSRRLKLVSIVTCAALLGTSGAQAHALVKPHAVGTAQTAIVLAGGPYYPPKKKPNYGGIAAGVAGVLILGAIVESQRRRQREKTYYPKRRETKPTYTSIECRGGRVRSGKCVCDDDEKRNYHGSKVYSCTPRRTYETASERPPEPPKVTPVAPARPTDYAPDEVVATFPAATADALEQDIARAFGLETRERFDSALLGERVVVFGIRDGRSVETVLAALRPDSRARDPQPNYYYIQQGGGVATVAANPLQYAFAKIEMPEAQSLSRGRGSVIALIDSLIDPNHPDLAPSVAGIYDVTRSTDYSIDAHSTAVAGLMTANGALRGVAPEAKLLCVRVVKTIPGAPGQPPLGLRADTHTLARGIEWAIAQNARILVMPLLGRHDPFVERIVKAALQRQAIIVAPAGNAGPGAPPAYPGAYEDVIAVTATDAEDRIYEQANQGGYIGVSAPGVNVLVLGPNRGHQFQSGTSLAAAHVAGIAALLLGYDPQSTPDSIRRAIYSAVSDLGAPGRDQRFGFGRVSAFAALRQMKQPPTRRDLFPPPASPGYATPQPPVAVGSIAPAGLPPAVAPMPTYQPAAGQNATGALTLMPASPAYATAAGQPQPYAPAPPAYGMAVGQPQAYPPAGAYMPQAPPPPPVSVGSGGAQRLMPVSP